MAVIPIVKTCCFGCATLEEGAIIAVILTMVVAFVKYVTGFVYLNVPPCKPDWEVLAFLKLKIDGYVNLRFVQSVLGLGNIVTFMVLMHLAFKFESAIQKRNPKWLGEWLVVMPVLYVDSFLRFFFSYVAFGFLYSIEHIIIVVLFTFSIHFYIVVNSFYLSLKNAESSNEPAIVNEVVIPIQHDTIIPMVPLTRG